VRRELFNSILEGYELIQNRLARAMKAERVEPIPAEGHPVDPERMIVLEIVEGSGRPAGTVVKELRRGYTWKGRLLRYAEVQAASAAQNLADPSVEVRDDHGQDDDDDNDESVLDGSDELGDINHDEDEDDDDHGINLNIKTDLSGGRNRRDSE